jgi:FdhD protein
MDDQVAVEEPIAVLLNGTHAIDVVMSPRDIREFVIGHLIGDGHILEPGDVSKIECGGGWVEATYEERGDKPAVRETIFSGCFGASRGKGPPGSIRRIESDLRLTRDNIKEAAESVLRSDAHRVTGGVHTSGIFRLVESGSGGHTEQVSLCDDIGRHNALDKAIGKAALKGCDLERSFAVTTGRASSEMVAKCYGARVPIIASRGATTTLAIEVAGMTGITLIAFARQGRLNVYANGYRVSA